MEEVRHDVLGNAAVGTDEILANAQEGHVQPGVQPREYLIDLEDLAALRVDVLASWENIE